MKSPIGVIAIFVAGGMLQLQGAACTSGATLNTYISLAGTGCEIGALTFYSFAWTPFGSNPQSPAGGLQSNQVTVNTLINSNGTGFQLTPTVAWSAAGGGFTDGDFYFLVRSTANAAIIGGIYQQINGSVIAHGYSDINEIFCAGGTTLPPAASPCSGSPTGNSQLFHSTIIANGDSVTDSNNNTYTDLGNGTLGDGCANGTSTGAGGCFSKSTFAKGVASVAVHKDIRADVTAGGTGGTASVTAVINQFQVVPEPGTVLLIGSGLGLLFLGSRRFRRG